MRKIVIEDYNEEWANEFEELKTIYLHHFRQQNIDVQHVGSTSVPGCAAKPILDIDIIIDTTEKIQQVISKLNELGYTHLGDLGIKGREAFKRDSIRVPYHEDKSYKFEHHLYICVASSISLKNHLQFRDYLRRNKAAVLEYSNLKKELANKYENDIDSYIENKTNFITNILLKTGLNENDVLEITSQNKKSS
jgi:GrpB-like predicted nucleotidyltransferase (UPF0157 family)